MKVTLECWKCNGRGTLPTHYGKDIVKTCNVCDGEGKIVAKVLEIDGDENEN